MKYCLWRGAEVNAKKTPKLKQLGIRYVYPRMRWPGSFKFKKAN